MVERPTQAPDDGFRHMDSYYTLRSDPMRTVERGAPEQDSPGAQHNPMFSTATEAELANYYRITLR